MWRRVSPSLLDLFLIDLCTTSQVTWLQELFDHRYFPLDSPPHSTLRKMATTSDSIKRERVYSCSLTVGVAILMWVQTTQPILILEICDSMKLCFHSSCLALLVEVNVPRHYVGRTQQLATLWMVLHTVDLQTPNKSPTTNWNCRTQRNAMRELLWATPFVCYCRCCHWPNQQDPWYRGDETGTC